MVGGMLCKSDKPSIIIIIMCVTPLGRRAWVDYGDWEDEPCTRGGYGYVDAERGRGYGDGWYRY